MLARELMSRTVVSVRPSTALEVVVRLLAEHHVSALPVVDPDGHVVGIVSEADILRLRLAPDPRAHLRRPEGDGEHEPWPHTAYGVMTPDPVVVPEGADVAEVAALLADTGWKSVPVVDEGRVLVGVVSRSDLLRTLATSDAQIWLGVVRALAEAGVPAATVDVTHGVVRVRGTFTTEQERVATAAASVVAGVRDVLVTTEAGGGTG